MLLSKINFVTCPRVYDEQGVHNIAEKHQDPSFKAQRTISPKTISKLYFLSAICSPAIFPFAPNQASYFLVRKWFSFLQRITPEYPRYWKKLETKNNTLCIIATAAASLHPRFPAKLSVLSNNKDFISADNRQSTGVRAIKKKPTIRIIHL